MRRTFVAAAGLALGLALSSPASAQTPPERWEMLGLTTAPLPPAVKTGRQDAGDAELYYAVYGRGEPVILLHSGLGNGDYWDNEIGPLSQQYQVIVVDLRGHGRSTASPRPLTYRLMADDIVHLIKAQKLKDPAIVGWGDGAIVGLELALGHPKRIGRLIAFGLATDRSGLQPRPDQRATFIAYVHKAQADEDRLSGDPARFTATLDQLEALWEREPAYKPEDLARIKIPVTLLAAQYDEWVKLEHMARTAEIIPNARMIMLPRTSYFAPWQAPREFTDAVLVALRP
jgi:pimeloyl-ACP methyl ester carboxylesterase